MMKKLLIITICLFILSFSYAQDLNPMNAVNKLSLISAKLIFNNSDVNWSVPDIKFIKDDNGISLSLQVDKTILISLDNEKLTFPLDIHMKLNGFKDVVLMINQPLDELIKLNLQLEKEINAIPNYLNTLKVDQTNEPFSKFVLKFD